MGAKVWPQQAWFLKVISVMLKALPRSASTGAQSGALPMATPIPILPSSTSSEPVMPCRAINAAATPASAARPECKGLDMESI
jgi:hypothetical protein